MKRTMLVMIVALLAISLPVFAQEFPDVPTDHWAYDAVQELADAGIIQGYPDGTFGGKRALTRYEFAEALAKAIPVIAERVSGGPGGVGPQGPPGPAGPQGPAGTPGVGPEQLAALQRLVDEFRDELAELGVDVQAMKADIAALNDRVTALEERMNAFTWFGEANLIGRGEVTNDNFVIDRDARGLAQGDNPVANSSVFVDYDFGLKAKVSDSTSLNVLLNAGNYLSDFVFNEGSFSPGLDVSFFDSNFVKLWHLYANSSISLGPLGATQVVAGRFPFQLTPYTLKFVDPDSYTNVTKLDSGDFVFDGARASFNIGRVGLTAFAGKAEPIDDLISPDLQLTNSFFEVSQVGGARAVIGTPFGGNLGLTYLQTATVPGRAQIYGADLNATFGSVGVAGEWAKSDPNDSLEAAIGSDDNNTAWNAKLNFQAGNLGIVGGYSRVEADYFAPGYWNRLGTVVNPKNVQGPMASLTYALSNSLSIAAEGQILDPVDEALPLSFRVASSQTAVSTGSSDLDKITYWRVGLRYGLTSTNTVDLGWEETKGEFTGESEGFAPRERFISLGLGHTFNPNSSLKLLYQIIDRDDLFESRGAVATAQFQLKY